MHLDPRTCRRLLVYGGSFDPPHRAHVELPREAATAVAADGVLYVPARRPPHKADRPVASDDDRLAMLERAVGERSDVAISRVELDRTGPSYTATTLETLRRDLGDGVDLRLLLGEDMARRFYDWHRPDRILELADPVVVLRWTTDPETLVASLPPSVGPAERERWRRGIVRTRLIEISSTELREALAAGDSDRPIVRENVPPAVLRYIRDRRLYERTA